MNSNGFDAMAGGLLKTCFLGMEEEEGATAGSFTQWNLPLLCFFSFSPLV